MSASAAAKQLGIHVRWVEQYNTCPDIIFEVCRQVGRKCILTEEHKATVVNFIDTNPSTTVVEVTENLLKQLTDLKVSRSTVYNFMRNECNLLLKKADFHSIERNSLKKIEKQYKWKYTDMNFLTNCVLLDKSAFDINMKRSRNSFGRCVDKTHFKGFVSHSYKGWVKDKTIAQWITNSLTAAGIDPDKFTAHSIRAAASTYAVQQGASIQEVKIHANWRY
ncbi:hypothetical protein CU097_006634 [Rhizopus azygosporus]|uniref:Tyr recombinase domain-containing protein n=1 Tax=Rhizopus azygosporus TaxID=86630 RepID=A0A367K424_RHIAZ|nr:hypothetical protein CU097_006634 [Rhizopus azygosporus]